MNEELIRQIVSRILSDPSLQGLLQGTGHQAPPSRVKSEALVLLNYVSDFPGVLATLQKRWGETHTLRILPSDQAFQAKPELPAGMSWISGEEALGKADWPQVILPTCSANTLAKAALGIRDNPISELIGRGISQGSSIELNTEYLGLTNRTPAAYRELYEGYLEKLKSYGVQILRRLNPSCADVKFGSQEANLILDQKFLSQQPNLLADEQRTVNQASKAQSKESQPNQYPVINQPVRTVFADEPDHKRQEIYYTKKFLGDKQAYGFPEASRVLVSEGTVISPLARDTLKQRRIELCLEREKGRGQG
ncbi:flavoprotein [Desulfosporosinus meridiei]|uniref:Flavoprotein n=1 Tax=Desulfosporosinus meridiei (strain ATCC BAA-275 / DSM 13257 / KCTC 12902 / NCIMB 13706 / S10) TaxID=768704 RepID=J7ITU2_DESMD|nr:flavoprotein [Desulfosporosinus meridiei]AFQ43584.1 Flavoprotein [Desulfosporosinus meridiei DSM 13257]AFQ43723.1 Flavoprotein [Desulfosporosinus meridiei DSM 13257]